MVSDSFVSLFKNVRGGTVHEAVQMASLRSWESYQRFPPICPSYGGGGGRRGIAGRKNRTLLPSQERKKVEIVKFPRLLVGLSRKTKLHNLTKMRAAALACRP